MRAAVTAGKEASGGGVRLALSFIIIGAQKSASTLLHRHLSSHPEVWMPPQEVPYLQDPYFGEQGLARLESLLAGAPPGRLVGIKRPDYLARPECPLRIKAYAPRARLLVILRDPVDRAVSAYYHYMREGWIPVRRLEEGMSLLLDGAYEARYPRAGEIVEFGRYHEHLSRYLSVFPRRQMLIMLQEDFTRRSGYERVQRFLGVAPEAVPQTSARVAKAGLYSLPRLRYLAMVRPLTHRTVTTRSRTAQRVGLPARAALKLDTAILARLFPEQRPAPSDRLRHRLMQVYEDDVVKLAGLLGQPLHAWLGRDAEQA